jgi:hypothetical protein
LPGLSYSDALRLGLVVVEEDEFPEELSAVGLGKLLEEFTASMAAACATSIALAFEKLVIEVTRETIREMKFILDAPDENEEQRFDSVARDIMRRRRSSRSLVIGITVVPWWCCDGNRSCGCFMCEARQRSCKLVSLYSLSVTD